MLESVTVSGILIKRPAETRVTISFPDGWGVLVGSVPEGWDISSAANTVHLGGRLRWQFGREAETNAVR